MSKLSDRRLSTEQYDELIELLGFADLVEDDESGYWGHIYHLENNDDIIITDDGHVLGFFDEVSPAFDFGFYTG